MNQSTHTWIAVRAVALLEASGETKDLLKILKPNIKSTAIGAWIPDLQDSKKGSGDIDNHILKMKPYSGDQKKRFTVNKKELLKQLGTERQMHQFIKQDKTLSDAWWNKPYKATPNPGQHLANRAMALGIALIDQLILGDEEVDDFVPGTVSFAKKLNPNARTRKEQISTYFFMLSHFVADSCMPCHADARSLSAYSNGLHKELESHWSKMIGPFFKDENLLSASAEDKKIIEEAIKADNKINIKFSKSIPDLKKGTDIWKEIITVCRASFAVANIIVPANEFPSDSKKKASFSKLFEDNNGKAQLAELDKVVLHDAVLNVAVVWKHIWKTFK